MNGNRTRGSQRAWTETEIQQLAQWLADGHKAQWIAAHIGRSLKSVQNRINRAQHGMIGAKRGGTQDKKYEAVIPCLGCRQPFLSWDRQRNRLCPSCGREGLTRYDTDHRMLRAARGSRGE